MSQRVVVITFSSIVFGAASLVAMSCSEDSTGTSSGTSGTNNTDDSGTSGSNDDSGTTKDSGGDSSSSGGLSANCTAYCNCMADPQKCKAQPIPGSGNCATECAAHENTGWDMPCRIL